VHYLSSGRRTRVMCAIHYYYIECNRDREQFRPILKYHVIIPDDDIRSLLTTTTVNGTIRNNNISASNLGTEKNIDENSNK